MSAPSSMEWDSILDRLEQIQADIAKEREALLAALRASDMALAAAIGAMETLGTAFECPSTLHRARAARALNAPLLAQEKA